MVIEFLKTIPLKTPKHNTVLNTARSTRSLLSRFLRDEFCRKNVAALLRLIANFPFQTGVDHRNYIRNGDGGLCDIRGEYDPIFRGVLK